MSTIVRFSNCRILRGDRLIVEDLVVEDGKVISPEHLFYVRKRRPDFRVDCGDAIVTPGFIDMQINGGYGFDFSHDCKDTEHVIDTVARQILAHGVTSFLPTLITSSPNVYHHVLPRVKPRAGGRHGAAVLGAHVEGPFICRAKKGAHPVQHIRRFDAGLSDLEAVYGVDGLDNVVMVTLAPELAAADDVIAALSERGVIVSIGHSDGSIVDGERAFASGARLLTHLFNAMTQFHHRDPGIIGLLTSKRVPQDALFYGIIADGIHTHPAAVRMAYRTHPQGLCLVTDAVSAMGLEAGRHHIGDMSVVIEGQRALIEGTDTLCGSIVTMDGCVRNLLRAARCSLPEALQAASLHPAQALRLAPRKGTLDFGADADFVLLSDNVQVRATYIAGECVYSAPGEQFSLVKVV